MKNARPGCRAALAAALWIGQAAVSSARPPAGEAVVVAHAGRLEVREFVGPVHEGRTEVRRLADGSAVGEQGRVMTGRDGWACLVLSPGPVLCVAPETELTIRQLRHTAAGLPKTEDDLVRRVRLELHRGRILLHTRRPTPSLEMSVEVAAGLVESHGGTVIVARVGEAEWSVISEAHGHAVIPVNGPRVALPEGRALRLTLRDDGSGETREAPEDPGSDLAQFEVCHAYFEDLEPFLLESGLLDRPGLARYLGAELQIYSASSTERVLDVSPSVPLTRRIERTGAVISPERLDPRWDLRRILAWYDRIGEVRGVNYIPSNAVNSTDMWLAETFDADRIGEELAWARHAGYNALRVPLQVVVWRNDREGFLRRFEEFLGLARDHGLRVVPVLFDDMNRAGIEPFFGPQPEPVEGRNNARWTPCPGPAAVRDRAAWPELERYVREVIGRFRSDSRILFWDLYNRPGDDGLGEATLPLLDQVFLWARDVAPDHPLAAAAWGRFGSAMTARMLERSDLVSFHSFESPEQVEALLQWLQQHGRPVLCTDWLMRQEGNRFDTLLPLFALHRVGWFNRGLVQGKTQQWIPAEDRRPAEGEEPVWQHDVLRPDGEPYDPKEIEWIQSFRFVPRS